MFRCGIRASLDGLRVHFLLLCRKRLQAFADHAIKRTHVNKATLEVVEAVLYKNGSAVDENLEQLSQMDGANA